MTAGPFSPDAALASVDRVLAAWALAPVAPARLPVADSPGLVLAETLVAPAPLPARAIALRDGWAVASAETAGASPYSPVLPGLAPVRVLAGAPLPPGADAVLLPDLVDASSGLPEVVSEAFPGEGARRAGEDLLGGAVLAQAGRRLSELDVAATRLAGIEAALVRVPRLRLVATPGCPVAAFLARAARERGARVTGGGEADLLVRIGEPGGEAAYGDRRLLAAGVALRPGETARCGFEDGTPLVLLPSRLDAALGLLVALVLPAIDALAGAARARAPIAGPLSKKIASQVGFTEVALLGATKGVLEPLATGDLTLAAILRAGAFLLVPPESEGYAAGERVEAHPLPGRKDPAAEEP